MSTPRHPPRDAARTARRDRSAPRRPATNARQSPAPAKSGSAAQPAAAPEPERLQKYLARAGVASRRHAEELIAAGAVTVNGQVVREQGTRVTPQRDEVRVDGWLVATGQAPPLYVLLNKPMDAVTTAYDPEGRRTVLDLLPPQWREQRFYPVGRLDRFTEGLLLLTNDGELALRLTHPRYALEKEYHALVVGHPTPATLQQLARGIPLEGESRPTAPARLRLLEPEGPNSWVSLEIHEGRNRQARRMLEAVGHRVLQLRRVRVGPLTLGDMLPGTSRLLTEAELAALRHATTA
ncbi:MAG: pseudouridine synthase [Ktedonobacterales bacterium]